MNQFRNLLGPVCEGVPLKDGSGTDKYTPELLRLQMIIGRLFVGCKNSYDSSGNVTKDVGGSIAFIQYDINNLPISVYKTNGTVCTYYYDAAGNRVQKYDGYATTYYIQGADGKTEAFWVNYQTKPVYNIWGLDNVGQVKRNGTTLTRFYYLKDHLGSIKMTVNSSGGVDSWNDFYPYGMQMEGRNGVASADGRYKFTGKELDVETGLNWFGARTYDPFIGRWNRVDPSAMLTPGWTPYRYGFDNPERFYDSDGRTEKERNQMVNKAQQLLGIQRGETMSGLKGNNKMDCGVVVRLTTQSAGIKDPVWFGKGLGGELTNSVARIASMGRESSLEQARPGDVAIFNTGSGDYAHVGQITKIISVDENGNVTNFEFVECSGTGKKGEVKKSLLSDVTNFSKGAYTLTGVYQIDTPDNENKTSANNNNGSKGTAPTRNNSSRPWWERMFDGFSSAFR